MSSDIKIEYNLSDLTLDIKEVLNNPKKEIIEKNGEFLYKQWLHNKTYNIIKYNKNYEYFDPINGLCRSIIFSNGKINVFSPPKAINFLNFVNIFPVEQCYGEEIIEGTMINIFYDNDTNSWNIATKTSVGGKIRYFQNQENFNVLFDEICNQLQLNLNEFDNKYMYSLVMQHPKNKFVLPINEMKLYLIAIYKIEDIIVTEIPREKYGELNLDHVFNKLWFPYRFYIDSYENLVNSFGTMNNNINNVGVMIKTFTGVRTKIVSQGYKYIKNLRGNSTKLQFQYLCLRKDNRVKEYLNYFPESRKEFSEFRKFIHIFTQTLYRNYISCYIKKEAPLLDYPQKFRTHMYNLHQHYLMIKTNNGYINRQTVIDYINNLEPAILMYTLNYDLREIGKKYCEQETEVNYI